MREILFRGKRVDNGEWIYGDLLQSDNPFRKYIRPENSASMVHVDCKSIGQYTGLCDKNGKKIFEQDIVREVWGERIFDEHFVVRMDSDRRGWFPFACGDGCGCCEEDVWQPKKSEVIGNIHDNPDLLKGDTNDTYTC